MIEGRSLLHGGGGTVLRHVGRGLWMREKRRSRAQVCGEGGGRHRVVRKCARRCEERGAGTAAAGGR